jgi:predicted RNase H-like HicB family nuclease
METVSEKHYTERIVYVITENKYVGYPVNLPQVIAEANTLDELKERIKKLMTILIDIFKEGIEKNSFELVEVKLDDWKKNIHHETGNIR